MTLAENYPRTKRALKVHVWQALWQALMVGRATANAVRPVPIDYQSHPFNEPARGDSQMRLFQYCKVAHLTSHAALQ